MLKFEVTRSGSKSDTLTIKRFAKIAPLSVSGVQKNTMKLTFTTTKVGTSNVVADNGSAGGEWSSISEFKASTQFGQGISCRYFVHSHRETRG